VSKSVNTSHPFYLISLKKVENQIHCLKYYPMIPTFPEIKFKTTFCVTDNSLLLQMTNAYVTNTYKKEAKDHTKPERTSK